MKKLRLLPFFVLFVLALPLCYAQQGAQLTITDTGCTTTSTCTYLIYRAPGACPASGIGTLTYAQVDSIANAITGQWTDPGPLAAGTYCYYASATNGGGVSLPSNTFQKAIQAPPPPPPVIVGK